LFPLGDAGDKRARLWSECSAEYVEALPNKQTETVRSLFTKARSLFAEESSTVESASLRPQHEGTVARRFEILV
jgi:hypothetical protein